MRDDPIENQSLQYFAHSIQIGYWTIVSQIIGVESMFLEQRCHRRRLEIRRKC